MLIKVKQYKSPMQKHEAKRESDAQYRIHSGIARAALEVKATGKTMTDAGGRPFYYANGAANFGFRELEARRKGRSTRTVVVSEKAAAARRIPWPWEKK